MKKLRRQIRNHGIFVASLLITLAILMLIMSTKTRPMTIQEVLLLDLGRNMISVTSLRLIIFMLILANISLIYLLVSGWFAKRRAGLTTFMLACMPVWILMQAAIPRFALVLTPLLVALLAFDRAGRSDKRAPLWYALCGIATTAAWLQEPVGVTILMLVSILLLMFVKPRYVRHIARQSSLVLIILISTVAAISAASWKFGLGTQDYLVKKLSSGVHITLIPELFASGPTSYHFGLPGVSLVPLSVAVLAGLGAWQLFIARKRPRNTYILVFPVLLGLVGLQFEGLTALLLISVTMIGIAIWAVMGVQYLHVSWKRVFPHNKLANSVGDLFIATMLASLVVYSFWYVNRGWNGNPQAKNDARIEWQGEL